MKVRIYSIVTFLFVIILGLFSLNPLAIADAPLSWHQVSPLPFSRLAGAAVPYDDKIYFIGGSFNGSDSYRTVEKYDPLTNTWTEKTQMPTPRFLFGATELEGKIYVFGGYNPNWSSPSNAAEVYDVASDTWTVLQNVPNGIGRVWQATTLNNKIYALDSSYHIDEYNPVSDSWNYISTIPTPRGLSSMTAYDNKIYIIGGDGGNGAIVEAYDPATDTWEQKASLNTLRSSLGTTVANGKIYAVDGLAPGSIIPLSSVEEYDSSTNTWSYTTPTEIARYFPAVTSLNNSLYVIGGYSTSPTNGSQSSVESAQVIVTPTPTPQPVTLTFTPSADTNVRSGQDNHNYGGLGLMRIQSSGDNRALVRFDQNELQSSISGAVLSAKLQVTIVDNGNNWGTGRTVDVHRLISDWAEGNGTENDRGIGNGATWNCAIDSLIENQAKNCSGSTEWEMGQPNNPNVHPWNATATDSETITNNQSGVVEYDVTSDVSSFLNGANTNYGWIIKKTNEGQNGQVSFGTKESSSIPQLVVTYQP